MVMERTTARPVRSHSLSAGDDVRIQPLKLKVSLSFQSLKLLPFNVHLHLLQPRRHLVTAQTAPHLKMGHKRGRERGKERREAKDGPRVRNEYKRRCSATICSRGPSSSTGAQDSSRGAPPFRAFTAGCDVLRAPRGWAWLGLHPILN